RFGSIEQARAALQAISEDGPAAPARRATPAPATQPMAEPVTEERWRERTALGTTEWSALHRAVDGRLGRPVVIEEFRAPLGGHLPRLHALARAGGPGLQRVLHLDAAAGRAVFETPAGAPLGQRPLSPRMMTVLARALAPLHAAGFAHGAITRGALVIE